jgi:8-oxo-dGTP pyrophosphatase MutT (NUDIX family)
MRQRGTAVVIRDNRVLLVRDKGHHKFSLPGGGIKKGEPTINAVKRELYEELGLSAKQATRLHHCDFKGSMSIHKVCLIEINGEPCLKGHELDKFIWWDMKEHIPVYEHVTHILKNIDKEVHHGQ